MNTKARAILSACRDETVAVASRRIVTQRSCDVIVVGAGTFGAWTAEHLRRAGKRVLLVDQAGPGHARASSGGESRLIRASYGRDEIYTRMANASLPEWRTLSERSSLPLFHATGVLFCFEDMVDYARDTIDVHRALQIPLMELDATALSQRWPQMSFDGIAFGLYEPDFGALMARRAVQELVGNFVRQGGKYRIARAIPSNDDGHAVVLDGELERADAIVYACGPWLGKVFPHLLGDRIFVTRQEVAFLPPPNGDLRFEANALPSWAYYLDSSLFYGFPNLESRGVKVAYDTHGPDFDPDTGDRRMTESGAAHLRSLIEQRFPALAGQPFVEFRVCQYENSSNGDFLIDRHPTLEGTFLVGAGSGHGFKHGPEVGRIAAALVLGHETHSAEPRFILASKASVHRREVL